MEVEHQSWFSSPYHAWCVTFLVSAGWVSTQLTPELEERYMYVWQELMQWYKVEGGGLLEHIVTSKEVWVHYSWPEMKGQAKNCGITALPPSKISGICRKSDSDTILGLPRSTCRVNSVSNCDHLRNYLTPPIYSVPVFCCSMMTLGAILPVWQLSQSRGASFILCTCLT